MVKSTRIKFDILIGVLEYVSYPKEIILTSTGTKSCVWIGHSASGSLESARECYYDFSTGSVKVFNSKLWEGIIDDFVKKQGEVYEEFSKLFPSLVVGMPDKKQFVMPEKGVSIFD